MEISRDDVIRKDPAGIPAAACRHLPPKPPAAALRKAAAARPDLEDSHE